MQETEKIFEIDEISEGTLVKNFPQLMKNIELNNEESTQSPSSELGE